jgi:uncharacterized membrane protein
MEHDTTSLTLLVESMKIVGEILDVFGVGILVVTMIVATALFAPQWFKREEWAEAIHTYKVRIGRGMLLGLEVLIAADIVKTVALKPTIANVSALGLLVLVRTFLSWTLFLEIEGHWPWKKAKNE